MDSERATAGVMQGTRGERIRVARRRAGLSQEALGEAAGVSKFMVMRYENDQAKPPSDIIFTLADALGVEARWLERGEGLPPEYKARELRAFLEGEGEGLPEDCKDWLAVVPLPKGTLPSPALFRGLVASWWAGERRPEQAGSAAVIDMQAKKDRPRRKKSSPKNGDN